MSCCLCATLWTHVIMLAMYGSRRCMSLMPCKVTLLGKLTSDGRIMVTVRGMCRQAWGRRSRAPGLPADMAHSARDPGQCGGVAGGRQCPRPCQECQQALPATLLAQVLWSDSPTALSKLQFRETYVIELWFVETLGPQTRAAPGRPLAPLA